MGPWVCSVGTVPFTFALNVVLLSYLLHLRLSLLVYLRLTFSFPLTSCALPQLLTLFATLNMNTAPPETAQPWAPNMVYRARRHKSLPQTLCEKFIEQQVFTFFRTYLPLGGPNFDYGPVMERATRFVMYIVSQQRVPNTKEPCTKQRPGSTS